MSKIAIIGSGVVGTATGKGFAHQGHDVTFVDVDPNRLAQLRDEGLHATDTLELDDESTFIFLTLPTPHEGYEWDLSAFEKGTRAVGQALASSDGFHTVVVRSTVPPGTTEGLVQSILEEETGATVGEGFALASNPEFLRAKSALEDFLHPWMTIIASRSGRTVERMQELLEPFGGELRTFSDPATTEMVKAAHNIFNAAKISFWNEMWEVCRTLGLDADEVASTVARSSEGSINPEYGIWGGAPYGGACLPKDTKGFLGFARVADIDMPFLEAVDRVNEDMKAVDDDDEADGLRLVSVDPADLIQRATAGATSGNGNGQA